MNEAINIPPKFVSGIMSDFGETGKSWLETIPSKFQSYCEKWNLIVDGEPAHGHLSLVVPVIRDDEKCVLKVAWMDEASHFEVQALQLWNGNGAVKLLNSDPDDGVQLLERLNFNKTLEHTNAGEAITVAGKLLRRLAIPAPSEFPKLKDQTELTIRIMLDRWEKLGEPFSKQILHSAIEKAQKLAPTTAELLVDHDLHYGNVLEGEREPWLVIDPKVIAGDPEFGLFPLMLRRQEETKDIESLTHRFNKLIESGELDEEISRGWTLVRCVDYWLWALSVGYTDDPKRCEFIANWLLQSR